MSTIPLQSTNLDWLRSTIVDIFPGLCNNQKADSPPLTYLYDDDNSPFDLSSSREPHDVNSLTFEVTEHHRNEMMGKLFNMMKISEMRRYNISILYRGLVEYFPYLRESDFDVLLTSYWCNGEHFNALIRCRGVRLYDNDMLRLEISDHLLDRAMSCGASMCKLKAMLVQKRKDAFARNPTEDKHKTLKRVQATETKFFKRNCCLRFWNHEVLVSTFFQLGWLTPHLAQIGLNKFLTYVGDRLIAYGTCGHILDGREEDHFDSWRKTTVMVAWACEEEDDPNEPREESRRRRRSRQRRQQQMTRASINSVMPNSSPNDDDDREGVRRLLVSYADITAGRPPVVEDESEELFDGRSREDVSEQIGEYCHRPTVSLSERNLRKWMNLLELTTSRGARFSVCSNRETQLRVDENHRLHVSCPSEKAEIRCVDCSCLMNAMARGENTFGFLHTSTEVRNNWLTKLNVQMPKDLWNIVDFYL